MASRFDQRPTNGLFPPSPDEIVEIRKREKAQKAAAPTNREQTLRELRGAVRRAQEVCTIKEIASAIDEEIGSGLVEEALSEEL